MSGLASAGSGELIYWLNIIANIMTAGSSFLYPILGQTLGTALGGSLQTVSSSLSSF